jgi:hypothetical protein
MLGRHSEVIRNKAFVEAAEKAFGFRHLYENVKNVSIPQPTAVTSDWLIEHASCSLKFIFFVKKKVSKNSMCGHKHACVKFKRIF